MALPPLTIYRAATQQGLYVQQGEDVFHLPDLSFDDVFAHDDPATLLRAELPKGKPVLLPESLSAPVASQEIWAAGVTYMRSREARKDESSQSGGAVFYDRVYEADRPELFFKATAPRAVGQDALVRIRRDSLWNVPEPEVALAINSAGKIFGYTIGNDMSSRDIEGENPLYLPQAKVYRGSCALGPGIVVREPLPSDTAIRLEILRDGSSVFSGETSVSRMKRTLVELAEWLYRELDFPTGAILLTGTGIIPPSDFTLAVGDQVEITIAGLGTLRNTVAA